MCNVLQSLYVSQMAITSAVLQTVMLEGAFAIRLVMVLVIVVTTLITPVLLQVRYCGHRCMLHLTSYNCLAGCTEGLIRLVDGNDKYEGRLEMCVDGNWGTVCENGFGSIDAVKACAQLNLPTDSKLS